MAPAPRPVSFRRFGRGAPAGPPTLDGVSQTLMSAAMAMQAAEVAPTARQVAACEEARAQFREVMERWAAFRNEGGDRKSKPGPVQEEMRP